MKLTECWYKDVCNVDCTPNCIRFSEMQFLMDNSNIPKSRQIPTYLSPSQCDRDAFRRLADIKTNINAFVSSGKSLYITSKVTGNGKTSWAIKLLMKYFDTIWAGNGYRVRGLFIHTPTFLLKCKDFNRVDSSFDELKSNIINADLVVWDDFASNDISAYDCSQLLMYLDYRISDNKSNIFTGNLPTIEQVERSMGNKIASRLFTNATEVIEFNGGDRR